MLKKCRICQNEKPIEEFQKRTSTTYRNECKDCFREIQNNFYNKVREFVRDYKVSNGCSICGEKRHHTCLEFHHVNAEEKDEQFDNNSTKWSKARWEDEIKKCVILCATCHRLVHAGVLKI
ncbi:MAG: hypothetical protein ACRDD8_16255 [Bacteroidales bacterium]